MTAPLLVMLSVLAGDAQAPAPSDDRWQPWLGCWRADDDAAGTGARTCVTPGPDGGVSIVTLVGVQEIARETRIADDRERPVAIDDCRGTERSRWSARGPRLFRAATATCGSEAPRRLSSTAFMLDGPMWVEVQALEQAGDTRIQVRRFRPSANQRLLDGTTAGPRGARTFTATSAPWTIDDVFELHEALPPDAVQATIGEGPTAFALDKRSLVALSDAKVDERVIDLMVGLTYPSRFVVKSGGGAVDGLVLTGAYDPFFAPILGPAALYGCYSPYAWASPTYYRYCGGASPYLLGYGYGFYNGYYGLYNNPWTITSTSGGGTGAPVDRPEGRVVNGRGYTQVTPVDTTRIGGDGGSWGGMNSTGGSSGNSGGGSSGVSSGGYSGGGSSGGDGGRMAMPRPPGQ